MSGARRDDPHEGPSVALSGLAGAKIALRDQILTARGRLSLAERAQRAWDTAESTLAAPEAARAATVAAYVSVGREPGTGPLLDALSAAGRRVLLPLLLPDGELDWAVYQGAERLRSAPRGLLESVGPPLGPGAVAGADLVLVPGLAADLLGNRLGRGGGSYDRTLARVPLGTPIWVVLNHEEVLDRIPAEEHDRPVTGAATERGLVRLPLSSRPFPG